ncbi:MAG: hypothetical protein ACRDP6_29280 [Actinoallomurus sp.]
MASSRVAASCVIVCCGLILALTLHAARTGVVAYSALVPLTVGAAAGVVFLINEWRR